MVEELTVTLKIYIVNITELSEIKITYFFTKDLKFQKINI